MHRHFARPQHFQPRFRRFASGGFGRVRGRIVIPYRPKLVVLYAGDNDISAGKSPREVFADFQEFVRKVHAALPRTRIAFISIKPCPAREKYLNEVKTANRLIKEFIASDARLTYMDVFTPSLTADGKPRAELYIKDGLHPNDAGYKLWASIVKPVLDGLDPPQN
jgi:lysophospholipase L1-like esterase